MRTEDFNFRLNAKMTRITDREILDSLRAFADIYNGRPFTTREYNQWKDKVCHSWTISDRLGSWRGALARIGIETGVKSRRYSSQELMDNLELVWRELGRPPGARLIARRGFRITEPTYRRRWGSLRKAVHTLAMAAHGILRALNKKRGGQPMLGDPSPCIRPGFEKEVADIVVKSSNFFKHGDKDPLATDYFAPESNQCVILDACNTFMLLAQEQMPLMKMFTLYLAIHEPRVFMPEFVASIQRQPFFSTAKQFSKQKFFAEFLPDISRYSLTGS
jgi:hypothetical protein